MSFIAFSFCGLSKKNKIGVFISNPRFSNDERSYIYSISIEVGAEALLPIGGILEPDLNSV